MTQNNTALGLHLNIFVPCDGGDNLVCTISRVQAGSTPFTVPRCEAGRPITYTDSSIQDGTYVYILTVTNAMGSVDVETGMLCKQLLACVYRRDMMNQSHSYPYGGIYYTAPSICAV